MAEWRARRSSVASKALPRPLWLLPLAVQRWFAHSDGRMSSAMEPSTTMKCLRPLDLTPADAGHGAAGGRLGAPALCGTSSSDAAA